MNSQSNDFAPVRFSTEDLPERDRIAIFREQFGRSLFHLDIEPLPDTAFRSTLTMHAFPGVAITSNTGGGMREWRTRELISDARDDFVLVMNLKGPSFISQRGREFVMDEQAATFAALNETGGITRPTLDHHLRILNIPRVTLAPLVRHADDAIMRPIPRESAPLQLLIQYVAILQNNDAALEPRLRPLVAGHIHDLVAATIGARPDAMEAARAGGIRAARLATIRADVLANLSDPQLSAKTVGRRHGVSDRYVHLLFAETGESFGRFVDRERLERAFALLTHPTRAIRRISEIAAAVGFPEHSTFNRAFRRRFGDTPSAVRRSRPDEQAD
jgi:AraC-like DNA-binding protein